MFGYYLELAWRSLRCTPILTGLMVLAIGLGIGASMTMMTVLHVMTQDPLPSRSAHLYRPWLDPLPLDYTPDPFGNDPRNNLTYADAMALVHAHRAERQAAMAGASAMLWPQRIDLQPFTVDGHFVTTDFFAMFGVRFVEGASWSADDDSAGAHVVVLTESLARKLFGTASALGRMVRLDDIGYRVVGVTADWAPTPQFYDDASANHYSDADKYFLPLSVAVDNNLSISGNVDRWGKSSGGLRDPDSSWAQVWVQLDTPAQVAAYRQFLIDYSAQQKSLGRYQRPPTNAKLFSLMGWLAHENLVPGDVQMQFWLAVGFLGVSMLNIVALLLAKFLRRSGEISVRRALGATRPDIFLQLGVESALIGVAGGVLGLGVAQLGLWSIRQRPDDYARLAQMDVPMLLGTLLLAVCTSVLAGLLPAWRACRIPPALQLKAS